VTFHTSLVKRCNHIVDENFVISGLIISAWNLYTTGTAITKIFIFNNEMLFNERLKMDILRLNKYYCSFVMLISLILLIQPVLADGGTVTISYRGAGGYYVGDTITFDGRDTIGNTTLVKITGPYLPSQGVPLSDLNGIPGSGNTVAVTHDGSWKFNWYSANTAGIEKLVTARYTITAMDLSNPEKTTTTSVFLKKPEFYINEQLSPINPGDYVQLNGYAERGVTYVKIDVSDSSGKTLRSFISPVSGLGSFEYRFRADMPPGRYVATVSDPSMKNTLMTPINIVLPGNANPTSSENENVTVTASPTQAQPVTPVASLTPAIPLSPFTAIAGLFISAVIALVWPTGHRK
jgi:hypothetical protein